MKQYSKNGDSWWSHKADDGWCNGQAKRQPKTDHGVQSQAITALAQGQMKILDKLEDVLRDLDWLKSRVQE